MDIAAHFVPFGNGLNKLYSSPFTDFLSTDRTGPNRSTNHQSGIVRLVLPGLPNRDFFCPHRSQAGSDSFTRKKHPRNRLKSPFFQSTGNPHDTGLCALLRGGGLRDFVSSTKGAAPRLLAGWLRQPTRSRGSVSVGCIFRNFMIFHKK